MCVCVCVCVCARVRVCVCVRARAHIGHLKCVVQATASYKIKKTFDMSTFIFHAGIAVRQTFEALLSSTISHWGCLP